MASVKVYSTPTCPYCKLAKDFLGEKDVEFEEIDVATNQEAAEEMVKKSGQMGVPVIIVAKDDKEEVIVGFDKDKLVELLEISE
ncbi:glutathione S-transferase N-terminal domain-containing protein [Patescibacteria group bacterium]|nr:glutathione S-transferase N-terminal domain-containing protein [Patescibacteria group bacterium]